MFKKNYKDNPFYNNNLLSKKMLKTAYFLPKTKTNQYLKYSLMKKYKQCLQFDQQMIYFLNYFFFVLL